MRTNRQTIKGIVSFSGITIHNGKIATMTICPAPCNSGIRFIRVDTKNNEYIQANYKNVTNTLLSTRISNSKKNISITTIEHIMSALFICEIDDAIIKINSNEVPIIDGSAYDFTNLMSTVGTTKFDKKLEYIKITKNISVNCKDSYINLKPSNKYIINATIEFKESYIGKQSITFDCNDKEYYLKNIAPARTFGFITDMKRLYQQQCSKGSNINNTLLFDKNGPINKYRLNNECVKHKTLDLIGDLALSPYPILGIVNAYKMGHTINNSLLHRIFKDKSQFEIITL